MNGLRFHLFNTSSSEQFTRFEKPLSILAKKGNFHQLKIVNTPIELQFHNPLSTISSLIERFVDQLFHKSFNHPQLNQIYIHSKYKPFE